MAKRRSNGEGTYRKHDNGTWEWQVVIDHQFDGKPIRKSFYGKSKKEAKEKGLAYIANYGDGTLSDANGYTSFSEWADFWYENMKENVTRTTYEGYKYTLIILKDYFKDTPLCEIKAMHIEKMLKDMLKAGKSQSYISKFRGMLFQIFKKAEANELVRRNPVALADKIHRPRKLGDEEKAQKDSFTADEIYRLNKYLPDNRLGWSVRLMIGTGMRTQEVIALEPRHIAEDGSFIHVHQAITMDKGTATLGPTKSADSYRTIPVPFNLREYAVKLRNTEHNFCWWGIRTPFINPSTFRKEFRETLENINDVRVLSPHCCRHTFVTQMQAHGVDTETIRTISGHADIRMTEHYMHVQDEVKENAIAKINVLFAS